MAFVPEILAPRGALRAAATPSAGTRARAPRPDPEPGRDSTWIVTPPGLERLPEEGLFCLSVRIGLFCQLEDVRGPWALPPRRRALLAHWSSPTTSTASANA